MKETRSPEELISERNSLKKILTDINAKYLEKIEELSLIRRIGDALKDITDFSSVCRSIVTIIQQQLDPDNCSLMIVDEDRGEIVLRAAKGPYDAAAACFDEAAETTRFAGGESIAGIVARSGRSLTVQDVLEDARFAHRPSMKVQVRSLMCIPLVAGERVVAVLNLSHTTPNAFTPDKERLLSIIANSSATAIENTRLYEKLRESRDRLARENIDLKQELIKKFSSENIIGISKSFTDVLKKVEKVAGVDVNVLITGESGTGKELIARTLHYTSSRTAGPLVAVNCAALPESILESELFGIEKGVATGVERRTGKFELAHGGTIFLDEIGDMSLATQAKILRVLQERELQRVGGSKTIALDVRVLAATNRDLAEEIKKGAFREDLYYRLKVVEIHLPPLRQRSDDIPLLANFFLKDFCARHQVGERWFSREALALLRGSPWKGNVRELKNVVEQAAVLSGTEVIGPQDLCIAQDDSGTEVKVLIPESRLDYKAVVGEAAEQAERSLIQRALERSNNNRSRAARLLGIGRRTLLYKLDKL
jgi:Nif-specific regulatory protein